METARRRCPGGAQPHRGGSAHDRRRRQPLALPFKRYRTVNSHGLWRLWGTRWVRRGPGGRSGSFLSMTAPTIMARVAASIPQKPMPKSSALCRDEIAGHDEACEDRQQQMDLAPGEAADACAENASRRTAARDHAARDGARRRGVRRDGNRPWSQASTPQVSTWRKATEEGRRSAARWHLRPSARSRPLWALTSQGPPASLDGSLSHLWARPACELSTRPPPPRAFDPEISRGNG